MKKHIKLEILYIIIGSIIVSFTVNTIHSKIQLAEGGEIGIELLLLHWFNISPMISSICMDLLFYFLGFLILNKKFRLNAIIGTFTYSISYFLFEKLDFYFPFINNMLLSSIIGGLSLGFGCGLVVKHIGACGADDSLALILNKIMKISLFWCYFLIDIIIILISISYIKIELIPYSILTSFLSSLTISLIYKKHDEYP